MQVDHGPLDPEEKKNYSFSWFLLSLLFFIASIWMLVDEGVLRRPWKHYQSQFNKMELKALREQRKQTLEGIQASNADQIKALDEKIKENAKVMRSGSIEDLRESVQKKEKSFKDLEQARAFTKADLDEALYIQEHARREGASKEEQSKLSQKVKGLEELLAANLQKANEAEKIFNDAQSELAAKEKELETPQSQRDALFSSVAELDRKIDGVRSRVIEVKQIVSPGLGQFDRVDRCITCHVSINRSGFEDFPQPYKTHPRRDELFGSHPPETFGCTACHHGQGRALASVFKAHAYEIVKKDGVEHVHTLHHWEQPMYRGDFVESGCNDCHGAEYRLDKTKTYAWGTRFFVELGCHGCHLIDGYENLPKVGPSLNRIATKVSPEWMVGWIKNPSEYNPNTRMPNFRLSDDSAVAITAFLMNHSESDYHLPIPSPGAGSIAEGKQIFESVGCRACHVVGQEARDAVNAYRQEHDQPVRDHGPDLSKIGEKAKPEWIYNWILNPRHYNPDSRMPNLRLNDWQARSVTSYLMSFVKAKPEDAELRSKLADPEIIAKGKALVGKRGCYGCHAIQGFEKADRIGPELTNFSTKTINELFFGDTLNPDAPEKVEENWEDWTRHKLLKPNIYDTERVEHLMPSFSWRDPKEVEALLVFLKAQDGIKEKSPWARQMNGRVKEIDRGRHLVDHYNCNACHLIEGKGATVRTYIPIESMAPPNLKGAGGKIQPEWLFKFLHNPSTVRPWLSIRMPSFNLTDEEFSSIIRYLQALDGVDAPYFDPQQTKVDSKNVGQGQALFNSFACTKCHVLGNVPPGLPESTMASLAPNLRLAKSRLRHDWILQWLADPNAIVPGTRMPAFWDRTTAGTQEEVNMYKKNLAAAQDDDEKKMIQSQLDGIDHEVDEAHKQIRAVRDYVLSLNNAP